MRGRATTVYLGLGANLGDRQANILRALELLRERVRLDRVSSIYESPPAGYAEQPHFLNAVCRGRTRLAPQELLVFVKGIETAMGRVPTFPNGPRLIDIDVLLYGRQVVQDAIAIPHPRMAGRSFVLAPLAEIAPRARHPVLGKTAKALLEALEPQEITVYRPAPVEGPRRHSERSEESRYTERAWSGKHWLELAVTVPAELVEPMVELFSRRGRARVAIEEEGGRDLWAGPGARIPPGDRPVTVRGYLPDTPAGGRGKAHIEAGLGLLGLIQPMPPLKERLVPEREWLDALRGHFTLLRVGECLVVRPAWMEYQQREGEVVITLDPGIAFGTGHHPTTRLCLEALEPRVRPGASVLDVGTGSGVLAIAAAALGATRVLALDTDAQSVTAARRNVRLNGLQRRIQVRRGTLPLPEPGRFDVVVANITAHAIQGMLPAIPGVLGEGGVFIACGVLEEQREGLLARMTAAGLRVVEQRRERDWVAVLASHPAL